MTSEQIELIIEIIKCRTEIVAHPQTPPKDLLESLVRAEAALRATARIDGREAARIHKAILSPYGQGGDDDYGDA